MADTETSLCVFHYADGTPKPKTSPKLGRGRTESPRGKDSKDEVPATGRSGSSRGKGHYRPIIVGLAADLETQMDPDAYLALANNADSAAVALDNAFQGAAYARQPHATQVASAIRELAAAGLTVLEDSTIPDHWLQQAPAGGVAGEDRAPDRKWHPGHREKLAEHAVFLTKATTCGGPPRFVLLTRHLVSQKLQQKRYTRDNTHAQRHRTQIMRRVETQQIANVPSAKDILNNPCSMPEYGHMGPGHT